MIQTRLMLMFAVVGLTSAGLAADNSFLNKSGDLKWFTDGNWQLGQAPTESDVAYFNTASQSTADSPVVIDDPARTAVAGAIGIAWGANEKGYLEVKSDLNVATTFVTVGNAGGSEGVLKVSGGTATFDCKTTFGFRRTDGTAPDYLDDVLSRGTLLVDGGTVIIGVDKNPEVKFGENGSGLLDLRSGTVRISQDITLGNNPRSRGELKMTDGLLTIGRNISNWMGDEMVSISGGFLSVAVIATFGGGYENGIRSKCAVSISGGEMSVSNQLQIAGNGGCDWIQSGGRVWARQISSANGINSSANVKISGENAQLLSAGDFNVGNGSSSVASFEQDGGFVSANAMQLGLKPGSKASYWMTGGELACTNLLAIGAAGNSVLTQDLGRVTVGSLVVQRLTADNYDYDARSVYVMNGGNLSVANQTHLGFRSGYGTLALLGGSSVFGGYLFVGSNGITGDVLGTGVLEIGGEADFTCNGEMAIGVDNCSRGKLKLTGGGEGTHALNNNLYLNNSPELHVTVDAKGLTPLAIRNAVQFNSPLTVYLSAARRAKPGTYTVFSWSGGTKDTAASQTTFVADDPARWSWNLDLTNRRLTVTYKAPGFSVVIR